ncbi:hypothetical protein PL11_002445 [Lentilactobacillus curieae]|uniref:Metal-sensitive transcriptional regulator n=1 Tax=Lentilactobacillus curieae TaxID=1138822 RepID=A0A1S6QGX0_9LACO|nr:metal-sensitive transcriptional regulator [Lentilactobacillus curieae]AQW20853.1 hypothetical protein PL11_002445 [Lentilactobacillus curieae]
MAEQQSVINRLKRVEGQLRGVQKMIADDSDCLKVINQLSAIRSSVDRTIGVIVAENLKDCLENPENDTTAQEQKINEAIKLIIKK